MLQGIPYYTLRNKCISQTISIYKKVAQMCCVIAQNVKALRKFESKKNDVKKMKIAKSEKWKNEKVLFLNCSTWNTAGKVRQD